MNAILEPAEFIEYLNYIVQYLNLFINKKNFQGVLPKTYESIFSEQTNAILSSVNSISDYELIQTSLVKYFIHFISQTEKLNDIAKEIIDKYLQYKQRKFNDILLRSVILYSKKELKLMMYCFRRIKRSSKKDNKRNTNKNEKNIINNLKVKADDKKDKKRKLDLSQDFFERQNEYNRKQSKSREKIIKKNEELNKELCPFIPQLFSKKIFKSDNPNVSAYERLYNDGIKRKEKESRDDKLKKRNHSGKKRIDHATFEKLYEDYKIREIKNKKLISQVDEENGCTFSPETNRKMNAKCPYHNQYNTNNGNNNKRKGSVNKRNCNFIIDIMQSQNKSVK